MTSLEQTENSFFLIYQFLLKITWNYIVLYLAG